MTMNVEAELCRLLATNESIAYGVHVRRRRLLSYSGLAYSLLGRQSPINFVHPRPGTSSVSGSAAQPHVLCTVLVPSTHS